MDKNLVFAAGGDTLVLLGAVRGTITDSGADGYLDIPDAAFRWDGQQWIFNLATSGLPVDMTTYVFRINVKGPVPNGNSYIQFVVGLK